MFRAWDGASVIHADSGSATGGIYNGTYIKKLREIVNRAYDVPASIFVLLLAPFVIARFECEGE
jgi:hypothetical protein